MSDYVASLDGAAPAPGLSAALRGLWWAGKGDWEQAHQIVQQDDGQEAAWVHAYLHRVEGDLGNAGYWYRRASRTEANDALQAEWERIAATLLGSAT